MKYLEIDFFIGIDAALMDDARALLAEAAGEAGCESFEDSEQGLKAYVQVDLWDEALLQQELASFAFPEAHIRYTIREAEDKDWNAEWEANGFEPIEVDGKLVICDAKNASITTEEKTKMHILIDAKLAFGTGTHETTQMIVSILLRMELSGKRVLDCGCGTGILGIVASKLGAAHVVGYDIDEWSVKNALHNAELNEVANMEVYHGDAQVLQSIGGTFDVVLANINRNILLGDLPTFARLMHPESILILSGFYTEDVPLLTEKAQSLSLTKTEQRQNGDWCSLVFRKG